MKLTDEIRILQEMLNEMLEKSKLNKQELIEYSQKLDKLIIEYYLKDKNK
ncbi:aspartyl-phosphate phosphatase Spo0E family protein [Oxobacter pfennigii]|nr:aspartyl-phosphate phosphatase Spo0E family protein [Oxobacter pfennigii]